MGLDRRLFISNTWEPEDIKELLCTLPEVSECKFIDTHTPSYIIISFKYDGNVKDEHRQMSFHYNSKEGGFRGHLLTLGASGSAEQILKAIAERIGGFYNHQDCDNNYELFHYAAESSLEFMVRHSVLRGKCDGRDFDEFAKDYKAETASWEKNNKIKL
jgi:hypothetical protein